MKDAWSYTSIAQYAFMQWCLIKQRDSLTIIIVAAAAAALSSFLLCFRWKVAGSSTVISTGVQLTRVRFKNSVSKLQSNVVFLRNPSRGLVGCEAM
jgi:hypothetical protein